MSSRWFSICLLLPLLSVAVGNFAAAAHGINWQVFFPNYTGAILGAIFACMISAFGRPKKPWVTLFVASLCIAALAMTLLFDGQENVHRWLSLGPVNVNAGMIVLPVLLYCLDRMSHLRFFLSSGFALSGLLFLFLQPDLGQAICFGVGAGCLLLRYRSGSTIQRVLTGACLLVLVVSTGLQKDSLPSVTHVEGILSLIFDLGLFASLLGAISFCLALAPFAFGSASNSSFSWELRHTYLLYFIAQLLVTTIGNFPVPLFGAGASSVLGWYLAIGLAESTRDC